MLRVERGLPEAPAPTLDPDAPPLPSSPRPTARPSPGTIRRCPARCADDLGRPVELVRDLALMPDLGDSLLVTVASDARGGLGRGLGRRPRPAPLPPQRPCRARRRWPTPRSGWEGRTPAASARSSSSFCTRASAASIPTHDPDTQAKDAEILRWLTRERDRLFGINARVRGRRADRRRRPGQACLGRLVAMASEIP